MIWIQKAKYGSEIIDEEWVYISRKWAFFNWNILVFLVAWACDSRRVIFHSYCIAVACMAGISVARMGMWDKSSGDTRQCHPTGISEWLAILRPHFNFCLFSGKKKQMSYSKSAWSLVHIHSVVTPLSSPIHLICGWRSQSSHSEGSGNPYLGFIKSEISLEV